MKLNNQAFEALDAVNEKRPTGFVFKLSICPIALCAFKEGVE